MALPDFCNYLNRPLWAELLGLLAAFAVGMAWAIISDHRRKGEQTMKVSYKVGRGRAVLDYRNDKSLTMEQVIEMVKDPNVLQITITKMTTKEYLEKAGAVNE